MFFRHSEALWADYPELVPGVLYADGISAPADVSPQVARFNAIAASRLAQASEGEFPEVQAWRRTFFQNGPAARPSHCCAASAKKAPCRSCTRWWTCATPYLAGFCDPDRRV
jgi:DNA/RNA-binding domain of Phe-tRNA-synthetase-like protein